METRDDETTLHLCTNYYNVVIGPATDHSDTLQQRSQTGNTGIGHHHRLRLHPQAFGQRVCGNSQGDVVRINLFNIPFNGRENQTHTGRRCVNTGLLNSRMGRLEGYMIKEGRAFKALTVQKGSIIGLRPAVIETESALSGTDGSQHFRRSIPHRSNQAAAYAVDFSHPSRQF